MEQLPLPLVRIDVALVHVAAALPLAWLLSKAFGRGLSAAAGLGLAGCLLGLSLVPMLAGTALRGVVISHPLLGLLLRTAVALGLALSVTLLWRALAPATRDTDQPDAPRKLLAAVAMSALIALLLPWHYVAARTRRDLATLSELASQSRVGEARALVHQMLVLDAAHRWNGYALGEAARIIDQTAQALESRVAAPLPPGASDQERLQRARQLAMLGQSPRAIELLEGLDCPEAASLYATVRENQGAWSEALERYTAARLGWELQPASLERAAGLQQAVRGMAYAERKLGRYDQAAATYRELLMLAPTAESHFLAAQFYEDAQQADQARVHARAAMALAPQAYRQRGEELIRKLGVYHFGCLGVYRAENGP